MSTGNVNNSRVSSIPKVVVDALNAPEDDKVVVTVSLVVNDQSSSVARRNSDEFVQRAMHRNRIVHPCHHIGMDLFVLRNIATTTPCLSSSPDDTSSGSNGSGTSSSSSSSSSTSSCCTSSSSSSSSSDSTIITTIPNHFQIFVINVQRGSAAFDALLKEGDEIVEWMGEKIASERQFFVGIAFCPTFCLTLKRTETTLTEKRQRLKINSLETLLHLKSTPSSIFPVVSPVSSAPSSLGKTSQKPGSTAAAVRTSLNHEQEQASQKSKKLLVQEGSTSSSTSALNTSPTETLHVPNTSAETKKKRNISEIQVTSSSLLNSNKTNTTTGQIKGGDTKRNSFETSQTPAQLSHEIFSTPLNENDLPRTWTKTSNNKCVYFQHIESGIKVYNSRVMNRVMQLLFYASATSTNTTRPFMSVQDALKQTNSEYLEYKKQTAVASTSSTKAVSSTLRSADSKNITHSTSNNQRQAASLPKEVEADNATFQQSCVNQNKKLHFRFDLQEQPRGWLRFDQDGRRKSNIYWKHCFTQHIVNDAKVMPRVLQLLDARIRGSNITVKEAIKQAQMEKEKDVYTVDIFDSKKSSYSSSAHISNISMSSRAVANPDGFSNAAPTLLSSSNSVSSKRPRCNSLKEVDLPLSWRRERRSNGKNYVYVHISSGITVSEPRIMPRVLQLLRKRKETVSVKEAVCMAREEEDRAI